MNEQEDGADIHEKATKMGMGNLCGVRGGQKQ